MSGNKTKLALLVLICGLVIEVLFGLPLVPMGSKTVTFTTGQNQSSPYCQTHVCQSFGGVAIGNVTGSVTYWLFGVGGYEGPAPPGQSQYRISW